MKQKPSTLPPGTAADLLRAARAEFAARGFDGASVRAITGAANANLGAITYHFGSKQALYEAVLSEAMAEVAGRVAEAALREERAPLVRAGDVVRALFEHFGAHPEIPRLMLQVLASRHAPPGSVGVHLQRLVAALSQLVREGQADGSIRSGEPELLAMAIASNPLHLNLVRLPLQKFMQVDLSDAQVRERVIQNAVHFVRGGLAARREGGV
jgi:AcrR family transcriptional regulator